MVHPDDLTDVAGKTRSEGAAAFAARFYSRVWDDTAADPSFFRDAAVMLTPPFHSGKHFDMRLSWFRATTVDYPPVAKRRYQLRRVL